MLKKLSEMMVVALLQHLAAQSHNSSWLTFVLNSP